MHSGKKKMGVYIISSCRSANLLGSMWSDNTHAQRLHHVLGFPQAHRMLKKSLVLYLVGVSAPKKKNLETFLAGALHRECREFMRILTTFIGKLTEIHHN